MLRRPPTSITLQDRDLRDFKIRAQHRQAQETERHKQGSKKLTDGAEDGPRFNTRAQKHRRLHEDERATTRSWNATLELRTTANSCGPAGTLNAAETESLPSLDASGDTSEETDRTVESQAVLSRPFSPENEGIEIRSPRSPLKDDDFYYGGFVERASDDDRGTRSSSFAPEDSSTPQHDPVARMRPRERLPRSPLYLSQNVSSSPERRPTSGLTPRVVSRVASHNAPGTMFSLPARRPPQPRSFRHQANSFSYDSTERSSAAYDQERISSSSIDDSVSSPPGELSLDEDLGGASLAPSQPTSEDSSSAQSVTDSDEIQEDPRELLREVIPSSPHLPLPPPFSTVPRDVPAEQIIRNPETSPIVGPSSSPRSDLKEEQTTPRPPTPLVERPDSTPRFVSDRRFSPIGFLERLSRAYRERSPTRHGLPDHPSPLSAPTPAPREPPHTPRTSRAQTPGQDYQVYSDMRPPETQPQTPAHLPEARHQSRYHPSYTVPTNVDNRRRSARPNVNQPVFATPTRRGNLGGRSGSPIGLTTPGFQGLYGGRENGDEQQNWVEGVRAGNPEVRLIGLRDARNDGRSLNETPEREDFRPGR